MTTDSSTKPSTDDHTIKSHQAETSQPFQSKDSSPAADATAAPNPESTIPENTAHNNSKRTSTTNQSDGDESSQSDLEATPTKTSAGDDEFHHNSLSSVVAPLASADSDSGTPDTTPVHKPTSKLFQQTEEVPNELEIVEDVSKVIVKISFNEKAVGQSSFCQQY